MDIKKLYYYLQVFRDKYDWKKLARSEQLPPKGDWHTWLILAGRGFGKIRTGAETVRHWVRDKRVKKIALIANSLEEAQAVMVEGVSGILQISPPPERPIYKPSAYQLHWPNGAVATLFSAQNPERLRGPQFEVAWIDELAKFKKAQEVWDQVMFSVRLGKSPKILITTTPRPMPLLEKLLQEAGVEVTRGSTFSNAKNLSPFFLEKISKQYKNTSLGQQELYGELLTQQEGALWKRSYFRYASPST